MYNLPKFDSEKAAENLNKTYEIRYSQNRCSLPKIMAAGNGRNRRKQHRTSFHVWAGQLQPSSESRQLVYALANKKSVKRTELFTRLCSRIQNIISQIFLILCIIYFNSLQATKPPLVVTQPAIHIIWKTGLSIPSVVTLKCVAQFALPLKSLPQRF